MMVARSCHPLTHPPFWALVSTHLDPGYPLSLGREKLVLEDASFRHGLEAMLPPLGGEGWGLGWPTLFEFFHCVEAADHGLEILPSIPNGLPAGRMVTFSILVAAKTC